MKKLNLTPQMCEILYLVARLPKQYRLIRKDILIKDYSPHLSEDGLEILNGLIDTPPEELSYNARMYVRKLERQLENE